MLVFFSENLFLNFIGNVFLFLLLAIVLIFIVLILTTIKVNFKYFDKNYKIIIKLYIFGKIRYLQVEFDKTKLMQIIEQVKIKFEKNNRKRIEKELFKDRRIIKNVIKESKIDLEYLNLDFSIGTEFILLTTVIITTISTIFPMLANKFIRKYDSKNYVYKFTPIYNKNDIKLQLDCIISIKLVHIINVILSILFKKGVFKNVRTSNTRFNDNCYE